MRWFFEAGWLVLQIGFPNHIGAYTESFHWTQLCYNNVNMIQVLDTDHQVLTANCPFYKRYNLGRIVLLLWSSVFPSQFLSFSIGLKIKWEISNIYYLPDITCPKHTLESGHPGHEFRQWDPRACYTTSESTDLIRTCMAQSCHEILMVCNQWVLVWMVNK